MKSTSILALLAAATLSVSAFAQIAPPTTAPSETPKAGAPAPTDITPAPKPAGPGVGGTDIISPDAVKKVDDQDLINQLTQQPKADDSKVPEQVQDMLDRMTQSQDLLTKKDPGEVTQETQRRILTDLDVLIEFAKKNQQGGGSGNKPNPGQQPKEDKQFSSGQNPGMGEGGTQAAADEHPAGGGQSAAEHLPDIVSGPAEWGSLGPKDRNLVSHFASETPISAYTDMIKNYYSALADLDKNRKK